MRKAEVTHTTGVLVQDIPELVAIRAGEVVPRDVFFESGRCPSPVVNKDGRASRE